MKNATRALMVALLAAALPSTACEREPDVTEQVEQRLEAANLDQVDVKWDNDARIAHLTGQVRSPEERQRAEEIATSAVGTSGTILNELTVEGLNEDAAGDMDGEIRDRLTELVDGDPELVVHDDPSAAPPPPPPHAAGGEDDDEARITVRLPGYLKDLIASEAETAGDSVNSYVVDLLSNKARRRRSPRNQTKTTLEL